MKIDKKISEYMSELGKRSWQAREKKYNIHELMSANARAKKGMKYRKKPKSNVGDN